MEALAAARKWVVDAPPVASARLTITLSYEGEGRKATVVTSELDSFSAHTVCPPSLFVSVEGAVATPLNNFLQALVKERLGDDAELPQAGFCLLGTARGADGSQRVMTYGLDVLYHSAELLADEDNEECCTGRAKLVPLPLSFPWSSGRDPLLEPLRLQLQAEARCASSATTEEEAREHCEAALELLDQARAMQPGNGPIEVRRAAVLNKMGRKQEALRALVAQQKMTPGLGRVYWRIGSFLAQEEKTVQNALVTVHGGLRWGVARTRTYPKLLSLARKCVLLTWGSAALAANSGYLPNGVLQLVLDHLSVWDVLRVSQVCYSWSVFASLDSYWRRRLTRDWGAGTQNKMTTYEYLRASPKRQYRLLMCASSRRITIHGFATVDVVKLTRRSMCNFRLWGGQLADWPRMVWQGWLRFLEANGYDPANCVLLTGRSKFALPFEGEMCEMWTLGGAVLGDKHLPNDAIVILPAWQHGLPLCRECGLFVGEDDSQVCRMAHRSNPMPISAALERVSEDGRQELQHVKYLFQKKVEANKGVKLREWLCHPCCGRRHSDDSGASLRNGCTGMPHIFEHSKKWCVSNVVTAVPNSVLSLGGEKNVLSIDTLAVNKVKEDDWFCWLDAQHAKKTNFNTALHLARETKCL